MEMDQYPQLISRLIMSCYLGILVNLSVGIIGDNGRVEEIEEAVGLHLLGDGSNAAFGLVFLFLLDLFHCEVLAFLPLHCTASAFDDFWTLQHKNGKFYRANELLPQMRRDHLPGARTSARRFWLKLGSRSSRLDRSGSRV